MLIRLVYKTYLAGASALRGLTGSLQSSPWTGPYAHESALRNLLGLSRSLLPCAD